MTAPFVPTRSIREAVRGHEVDVLDGLGIAWKNGHPHIRCPYPSHGGDNDWRWDAKAARARCTCTRGDSVFDVTMKVAGLDFEEAKIRIAQLIGRTDLIRVNGERYQAIDAKSLLNPPSDNRDDGLVRAYLAYRLGTEPGDVLMPQTLVAGFKALPYFDPPEAPSGKPKRIGEFPCAIFGTVGADGKQHAHRIYVAPGGQGKAFLGARADGHARDPKKSAKVAEGDNISGRSVLWGNPGRAPWIILAEGIETAAAIAFAFRAEIEAEELAVAAAISATGVEAFEPWPATKRLTVAADRDDAPKPNGRPGSRRGEQAARALGIRRREGLAVAIAMPGEGGESVDWLDILLRDGAEVARAGILKAELYVPTQEEIEAAEKRAATASQLEDIKATYPLPQLDTFVLDYCSTKNGRIKVHKFIVTKNEETGRKEVVPVPIATPFGVPARLRYADQSDAYGLRITVQGMDGQPRPLDFERGALARTGASDIRSKLFAAGLRVEDDGEHLAVKALKAADPTDEITVVSRPGWHDLPDLDHPVFVTPAGEIVGALEAALELAASTKLDRTTAGTLDGWKEAVAAAIEAPGCPHFTLGTIAGFVGPVLSLARLDSCGVNLSGRSSGGKTTAQKLAASAWSSTMIGSGMLQSLRTTENAVESIAQAASGTILALDEMAHVDGRVTGRLIYSIAGGQGKARLSSEASLRQRYSWTTFALLSGECSLEEKVRGDGGSWLAGMAVRFPDVDVTINRALPRETLSRIDAVRVNHGHAGPAFVRALAEHGYHTRPDDVRASVDAAARQLAGDSADSARMRSATPFGLLMVSGGLAKQFGLLPDGADIAAVVRWAWRQFEGSSDARVLDPDEQIIGNLRAWIAERWNVTIKPTEPHHDIHGNIRTNNRETLGWYDVDGVYIPTARIYEAAGAAFKEAQIAEVLDRRGMLAKRRSANRIAVQWVPKIGEVSAYALKRDEFGHGSGQPEFTVHEGHRS